MDFAGTIKPAAFSLLIIAIKRSAKRLADIV
jgi:hypothetical protein